MNDHDKLRTHHGDELSRRYHAADKPEPSAAIDAAILAAARSAVDSAALRRAQDTPVKRGLQRWRIPFALAATVLLSVTVTTLVQQQQTPGTVAFQLPPVSVVAEPAGESVVASAPLVVASNETAGVAESANAAAPKAARAKSAPTQATPMAADAAGAAESSASADAPMEAEVDQSAPPASVARLARERKGKSLAAAPVAAAPPPPATNAAIPAQAADTGVDDKAMAVTAPPQREQRALSARLGESARLGAAVTETKSPEQWISEIRDLKRAGSPSEAAVRLQEFRKRFPDYVLPVDLKPASTE